MEERPPGDGDPHHHEALVGAGHVHAHGPATPVSAHLRRVIAAVLIPFGVAVVVGLIVLWPGGVPAHERTGVGFDQQTQRGKVTRVVEVPCSDINPADPGTCQQDTVQVTTGADKGRTFTVSVHPGELRRYSVGQEVILTYSPDAPQDLQYTVVDVDRDTPIALLAGLFAVAVLAVGRWRGLTALIALAISFAVLSLFILPAILRGSDPLLVAVVGASAIMLVALYLCHGLSARTSVAVLGTLVSLILIGVLGLVFTNWAHLTGNTSEETGLIHGLYPGIEIRGLLLAGFIIGSLGVLDDVTVTQTSAVWELKQADPTMNARRLYNAGVRIGRDHIASTVNTLVLAYAGAALPLLLLFSIAQRDFVSVATSELVAEEIARTLVGSIGLVASVPVTTGLAALIAAADHPDSVPGAAGGAAGPTRPRHRRRRRRRGGAADRT
ncbi:YibE/F family protein [Kitasatospora misakiensis]|uniref:YibE/F family protein n=1 Tax=Kitasatospora misakiensis TaxID=67330 RepID=A0ABW0XCI9_9ACTN